MVVVGPERDLDYEAAIMAEDRRSIVIVSHDDRLREVADWVLSLEDGAFGESEGMPVDPSAV